MACLIAGLRGGVTEDVAGVHLAATTARLLRGELSRDEVSDFLRNGGLPRFMSIVVNSTCNLRCRHCYLQMEETRQPLLTMPEWQRLTASICDSEIRMVCLSGKEVFVGSIGPAVVEMLQQARAQNRGFFRLGAVTNGTRLHLHPDAFRGDGFSYLDISMDGMREAHDAIRGQGAFDRTVSNVRWLAPRYGDRLFSMVTLMSENIHSLPEIVAGMSGLGFRQMGFGFYLPQKYTDTSLTLESSDSDRIFESLHDLASLSVPQPITVQVDLDSIVLDQALAFLRSDWFDPSTLKADRMGELYNEYRFDNGVTLQFRMIPYPTGIWKASRLNPDGSYLAAEDTVDAKSYDKNAIANIRDFDFDIEAMNRFAMDSPRVKEILDDYLDKVLPKLVEAAAPRMARLTESSAFSLTTAPTYNQAISL